MAKVRGNRYQGKRSSTVVLVLSMLLMLTVVLLMLLGLGILSLPVGSYEDSSMIGYRIKLKRLTLDITSEGEESGNIGEQWTEVLSWEPRAFLYHNFLSKEECEYLISLARPHMAKSTVVDSSTGKSVDSRVRTSSGTFLRRGQDKIIRDIEKRIADYTFIPVEHGEGLQVLHYEVGQKYDVHFDYFLDEYNTRNGGQRIATLLMYLSDVEEGGETVLPAAKGNFSSVPGWNERSECGKKGLSVKPKRGDALLFWSMRPDATLDPSSLHAHNSAGPKMDIVLPEDGKRTGYLAQNVQEYGDAILSIIRMPESERVEMAAAARNRVTIHLSIQASHVDSTKSPKKNQKSEGEDAMLNLEGPWYC